MTTDAHRSEVCIVALAEAFRGDDEVLCHPMGSVPVIAGARFVVSERGDILSPK